MVQVYRRARLFLWPGLFLLAVAATAATPATTSISDVVYRADGSPASGTLLISWPAFTTANNEAVAAGTLSVPIGPEGALSLALIPNEGATPSGTLYRVIYQLEGGGTTTEYWSVGSASPTTIASIRAGLPSGTTSQFVSKQYVDTAIAGKANETAVVHKTGAETIDGAKQFSVAPAVPAPQQATDAVNKGYVDGAVANLGSGSYVAKSGDAMTGPLTLPGDPTAPAHAATRHYVDTGLNAKANLVAGLIPTDQLASGLADSSRCLKGDQSWGACGTSSDAVSLQGIPIATAIPLDGEVPTYEAATQSYKPKSPGSALTPGMQSIKYASDLGWSSTPSADLTSPGAKIVSLSSCPPGVRGNEPEYWVYVSGTGTAEAVKVTGGTCSGDGNAGTLSFTTVNPHPAGYTVGSASGGLQEALIAGRFSPTNPAGTPQSGKIIVAPGEYKAYARVSIRASNATVDMSGSILECYMNDACLFIGDPSNGNSFQDVTLINPRGRPMVVSGTKPFIEVNSQKTRLYNVASRVPPTGGTFGSFVQVDDDQAFLLDGLSANLGYGVRCDATYCGAYVTAPGPFNTWSAVGWLKNLNISPQCQGNGVYWESGNTLRISDSVIQGYAQYGVVASRARGGYGDVVLENTYLEAGNCTNPMYAKASSAGAIVKGAKLTINGGEGPQGIMPCFSGGSCTGSPTDLRYYVVANKSGQGASNPFYAGRADSTGSGTISVFWPQITSATSYDLLVMTAVGAVTDAPYGTGIFAVATGIDSATACTSGVCRFSDAQGTRTSYTVAVPNYYPKMDFWPGDIMLGGTDVTDLLSAGRLETDHAFGVVNSELGTRGPVVLSKYCGVQGGVATSLWSTCLSATYPPQTSYQQGATIVAVKPNADGGQLTNIKGRFNFSTLGTGPSHIITLSDSNFAKTLSNRYNRPANDANDAFVGYDQGDGNPANIGISFGAPKSLSNYIGNVGDGTNWKERLTANLKEFKTDVRVNGNLTVTGTCTGCGSGTGGASAPAGSDGQLVMIDGASGFKVITNLSWDGTKFHIPGNVQVDGRLSVAGPLDTETDLPTSSPTLTSASKFKMAVDTDGRLKGSYNGAPFARYLLDTDPIAYSQITDAPTPYTLPLATATTLGGVKIGTCAAGTVQKGVQADGSPNCAPLAHNHSDADNGGQLDTTAMAANSKQGTGTKFAMVAGSFTSANYRSSDSNGNSIDSGVAAGPYSIPWITFRRASATSISALASPNKAEWWGVVLTFPLTTTQLTYEVGTADNTSNTYDIGIYDAAGNLKAHIGPTPGTTFAASTGIKTLSWLSPVTLQPGRYYLAYTSSCTAGGSGCAQLAGGNGDGVTFLSVAWMSIASGGTLNGPLTPPSDVWSFQSSLPAWAIR